ncbi:MAG TPA: hypothetical protein VG147_13925 [Solirubrobacteraceae bacterium]|jgi:hypothetical protein|nr:hypothetical protein [Solirubrobacteraceae bacterium]
MAALLAVLIFGAVVATAAQAEEGEAPSWIVEGKRLEKNETREIVIKAFHGTKEPITLTEEGGGELKVECELAKAQKGAFIAGSVAGEPGTSEATSELSDCTTTHDGTGCKVTEPIVTKPVRSQLVENTKYTSSLLESDPAAGSTTELVTLKFPGEKCTTKEAIVKGLILSQLYTDPEVDSGDEEEPRGEELSSFLVTPVSETHDLRWKGGKPEEFTITPLKVGSFSATLKGAVLVSLATSGVPNDDNWGAFLVGGPIWWINGVRFGGTESTTVKKTSATTLRNSKIEVECKKATTAAGKITALSEFRMGEPKLEECVVLKPVERPGVEKCIVEGGDIELLDEQRGGLRWETKEGEGALIEFWWPREIAKFKLKEETGRTCTATGEYRVTGEMLAEFKNATNEEVVKKLSFKCIPPITRMWFDLPPRRERVQPVGLKIGPPAAPESGEFCGEYEVELSGGNAGAKFSAKNIF